MTMLLDVVLCVPFLLNIVLANQECTFKPRTDLSCLQYLVPSEVKHGCLNSDKYLQFAGIHKEINGEMYINVHSEELKNTEPVWVRKLDGNCLNGCCDERTRKGRILLLPIDVCFLVRNCVHGFCQNHLINGPSCSCYAGYTGQRCETPNKQPATESATIGKQTVTPISINVHSTTLQPGTVTQKSTITYTANTCEDNPLVKCQDTTICSSNLKSLCPVSCKLCTPLSAQTEVPCVNNPLVKCSLPSICLSPLRSMCPATCGICGNAVTFSTSAPRQITTTTWFIIGGTGGK